ncbi:MAG: hypothetical protein H7A25_22395 [Leptospiraceae bacterium]|nr:hypothetical protein [Leptospiraceae bacterium]MCP5502665.1 hypothetical protein [Leptospiraceae bacterium]
MIDIFKKHPNILWTLLILLAIPMVLVFVKYVPVKYNDLENFFVLATVAFVTILAFRFAVGFDFKSITNIWIQNKNGAVNVGPGLLEYKQATINSNQVSNNTENHVQIEVKPISVVNAAKHVLEDSGRYGFSIYEQPVLDAIKYKILQDTGIHAQNERIIQALTSSQEFGQDKNLIYHKQMKIEDNYEVAKYKSDFDNNFFSPGSLKPAKPAKPSPTGKRR